MPTKVIVKVDKNKIRAFINSTIDRLKAALVPAYSDLGKEMVDYVRESKLSGQELRDTSNDPRNPKSTQLGGGVLKQALRYSHNITKDGDQISLFFSGNDHTKMVSELFLKGRGSWIIPSKSNYPWDAPDGRTRLHLMLIDEFGFDDKWITKSVIHPSVQGKNFLHDALLEKESYIQKELTSAVYRAIRGQ